jgi:hypothetical protein
MASYQYGIGAPQFSVVTDVIGPMGNITSYNLTSGGLPGAGDDVSYGTDAFPGDIYPAVTVLSGQVGGFEVGDAISFAEGPWDWTGPLRVNILFNEGNLTIDGSGSITTTELGSYPNASLTVNGTLTIDAKANPTIDGDPNYGIDDNATITIGATGTVFVENGSWLTAPNNGVGYVPSTFVFAGTGGTLRFGDSGGDQQATITNFVAGDTIDMPDYKSGSITVSGNTVYVHEGTGNVTAATLAFTGGVPMDLVAQPDASGGTMLVVQATPTPPPPPPAPAPTTDPNSPANPVYSGDPNADAISSEGLGPISLLLAPLFGPGGLALGLPGQVALALQNTVGAIGQLASDFVKGAPLQTLQNDVKTVITTLGSDAASWSVTAPGAAGAGIGATFGTEFGNAVAAGMTDAINNNPTALKPPADTNPPSTTMPTSAPAANNIIHALNMAYTDTNPNDLLTNISNVTVASSASIIATNIDTQLDTLTVQNPTEGSQINADGVNEQKILAGVASLNPQQITFLYAQSVGQSIRTAANELASGQSVNQEQIF